MTKSGISQQCFRQILLKDKLNVAELRNLNLRKPLGGFLALQEKNRNFSVEVLFIYLI